MSDKNEYELLPPSQVEELMSRVLTGIEKLRQRVHRLLGKGCRVDVQFTSASNNNKQNA